MAQKWIVIQHVSFEGPGLIAAAAEARGLAVEVRRMDLGHAVPPMAEVAGLVVMGGPMGVHDVASHPYLVAEQQLLRAAVERDVPVLGVCLGAQLLAAALGARVYTGPEAEVGAGDVILTADGVVDPVLGGGGATLPVIHWHQDTFELPPGATHLARSTRYAHQAFRVGRHAYAFQFHAEVDRSLAADWAPRLPPGIVIAEDRRAEIERSGRRIVSRFFDAVGAGTQAVGSSAG
ncbi:MAG: hypothetical protein A3I61_14000 [Acidobacteria bacterium RIFCSPLOWO2_02_FULL_68_18]|nr:MAG: hypothetical protein A3I61_14000 [Acidobacteria bacterium RIFCSPLOWO2_02_FULL_68_18]OFW50032.1 MAG: hypothetical protein A3G77_08950 [Acidobacteria bacterium RIFCSPLOWO2_12_FULL_68_19]